MLNNKVQTSFISFLYFLYTRTMMDISLWRNPFEVITSVVLSILVYMVYLCSFKVAGNESICDGTMN